MNIAVLGCGAIGGTLAARLTRAGMRVQPITGNPAVAAALAGRGYRVRELDGSSWSVAPSAPPLVHPGDDAAGAAGPYDLVIACTPATRLEAALEGVRPHLAPDGLVAACPNGLPEDRAARVVGAPRVVGCVVAFGATMTEPGSYLRTSAGHLILGRGHAGAPAVPADADEGLARARRVLEAAAPVQLADDLAGARWSKLAINCCTSALGAAGGDRLGPLLGHRFVRRIALEIFAEVAAVARAEGVTPAPIGGTFSIDRVAITDEERRARVGSPSLLVKHSVLLAVGLKYRRLRSSMLYALERGRTPDIDFLNGEVVRRGEARGLATPANRALVEAIRAIADGHARPGRDTLRRIHDALVARDASPGPALTEAASSSASPPRPAAPPRGRAAPPAGPSPSSPG